MNYTRREILQALAATGAVTLVTGCGSDSNNFSPSAGGNPNGSGPLLPPFPQPQQRLLGGGRPGTELVTRFANNTVAGRNVLTRTYEGTLVGPTLRLSPGSTLQLNLQNRFPITNEFPKTADPNRPHEFNTTNLHTHGLHVSPSGNSDNIFLEIPPQSDFSYTFAIPADHPGGTFFYHPHKHGSAALQMFSGMAGALILESELDRVPEVAAARDLVYLVGELNINQGGQVPNFTGDVYPLSNRILMVNGTFRPTLSVLSGEVVRLRLLNATVRTHLALQVDGHAFGLLALDGITLPALRNETEISLAVANRADVLIRAQAPGRYAIKKMQDDEGGMTDPEEIIGYLEVLPGTLQMAFPGSLPAPSNLPTITDAEITRRRNLTFERFTGPNPPLPGVDVFTIDQKLHDPNRVDQTILLNSVEEWTITNFSDQMHAFHIHTNPFQLVARDGVALAQPEWHDVTDVAPLMNGMPGSITIRIRFRDFTGRTVLHCHNVMHEDLGMIQTIEII